MTNQEILDLINARAAGDTAFATLVGRRTAGDVSVDPEIADLISAGRTKPRSYLITTRGLRKAMGKKEGRVFLQSLRAFAAAPLPSDHPAYDDQFWLKELLPFLTSEGLDIGDPETRSALTLLAGAGIGVTQGHIDSLVAASSQPDPITAAQVSQALSEV